MPHTDDELRRMLYRAQQLPYGSAQVALVEEVVRHADAGGHDELAYAARMLATSAYNYSGEPGKAFATFSHCLSEFDRDPKPYHERFAATLLWHFKWMVNSMTKFPEIPMDRTRAVLDDMERRYREGGYSLHAVYCYRYRVAAHVGDWEAAEQWYQRWCAAPRDELSDCEACDPSAKVWHLATHDRDEEAVALAEPVLRGTFRCPEQPQQILTQLLRPYVRSGREEQAVTAHRRAYRALRSHLAFLEEVADHVEFCARTGNEVRGLELVQRHLGWLDRAPSPAAAMAFAAAAALVLRRLTDAGRGDLPVPRPAHGDRPAGEVSVADLAADLAGTATVLAARFDERNGTPYRSQVVAATLAAEPLGGYLPLSATTRRPARAARPAPAAAQPATAAGATTAAEPATDAARSPAPPAEADPAELLELAEQRAMAGDWQGARRALRAFDDRYAERDLPPGPRATRLDWQGMELLHAGDLAAAADRFREAAAALREAGDELGAQAARSRLGALLCWTGEAAEGLPLVEESVAYVREHGDDQRRASALLRHGEVLEHLGRSEEALAAATDALGYAEKAGSAYLAASAALCRSRCRALDPDSREATAADARERFRPFGGDGYAQACLWYASLLADPRQAVPVLREAVTAADAQQARARTALGGALLDSGEMEEAIAEHLEAVALATEDDDDVLAASARLGLGMAYLAAGRPLEAAEAGEEALAVLLTSDDLVVPRDRCRELLVAVYGELGEVTHALEQVDELLASYQGFDHAGHRGHLQERAGELLWRADRDAEAAARFTAATGEYAAAGAPVDQVRALRRAMLAHQYGGDADAATAALAEVDGLVATLPDEQAARWEAAMVGYDGARLLAAAGRLTDAALRLEPVAARFRQVEAFTEALVSEALRGDLLIGADRPADAVPVLREVTAALPRDDPRLPHAAELLAAALDATGDADDAAEVRRRYGIEPEE